MTEAYRFGRVEVLPLQRQLLLDGTPAALGARAFDVLLALVERRDRAVGKNELLELVWPGLVVEENNLQVQVSSLRKLLGPQAIATIPGRGYRFTAPVDGAVDVPGDPGAGADSLKRPASVGNVPDVLPKLLGRDGDLQLLQSMIRSHRSVTVIGAGGIGKTRLAQAAAHALRDHWPDGCWIVELAPVAEPALLTATVAQVLGITLAGRKAAQEELLDALYGRSALLVLDNCEHLVDSTSRLVEAMAIRAPQVHVLATSQELLRAHDEQLLRLGALQVPSTEELADAHAFGAVALFVERVRALQPGFRLTADNVAAVAEICRRIDGLPLAIELAAARVPLLGVAGVRERLHERLRLLTGGARTALRRHQTLRETLEWSHALLGADDKTVFRRAGVFVGSFSLPVAQHVLADDALDEWAVLDHLAVLVDKSLLVVDDSEPPRYRLLESTRAYALEKLREAGETDDLLRRHAQATRAQFARVIDDFWIVPSQERKRRYLPDIDNLRAALDWAREAHDGELLVALTGAAAWLLAARSLRLEALRRCEEALALVDANTPPALEARLQLARAAMAWPRYEAGERAALARAVSLHRALGNRMALFLSLAQLAINEVRIGEIAAAERAIQEMVTLHDEAWPPGLRSELHKARFWLLAYSNRVESARVPLDEMLRLAEAAGDDGIRMIALQYQEQVAMTLGQPEEAVARGRALLEVVRSERFSPMWALTAGNLGTALTELGRLDEALPLLRESSALERQRGLLWQGLDVLALLALRQQRTEDAARVLGRSDAASKLRFGSEERIRRLVESELRQVLSDDELQRLMAEGANLSDEEATRIGFGD
jgi:predicted ATPase/DNA-binding winged helix-turn-helix (wHTH) protein